MSTTAQQQIESQVAASMDRHSTAQLVDLFEATDVRFAQVTDADDRIATATTRGWIMDALDRRDPEAFMAWIEGDIQGSPRKYFMTTINA